MDSYSSNYQLSRQKRINNQIMTLYWGIMYTYRLETLNNIRACWITISDLNHVILLVVSGLFPIIDSWLILTFLCNKMVCSSHNQCLNSLYKVLFHLKAQYWNMIIELIVFSFIDTYNFSMLFFVPLIIYW